LADGGITAKRAVAGARDGVWRSSMADSDADAASVG